MNKKQTPKELGLPTKGTPDASLCHSNFLFFVYQYRYKGQKNILDNTLLDPTVQVPIYPVRLLRKDRKQGSN